MYQRYEDIAPLYNLKKLLSSSTVHFTGKLVLLLEMEGLHMHTVLWNI
jgi:hypothetical protein